MIPAARRTRGEGGLSRRGGVSPCAAVASGLSTGFGGGRLTGIARGLEGLAADMPLGLNVGGFDADEIALDPTTAREILRAAAGLHRNRSPRMADW